MRSDIEAKSHLRRDTWNIVVEPIIDPDHALEEIEERSQEIPETCIPTPSHAGKGRRQANKGGRNDRRRRSE